MEADIKDLEEEIAQHEVEKRDMMEQISTLQADSKKLLDKNGAISKERNDERNALQNVSPKFLMILTSGYRGTANPIARDD
jgi:septal ring factor EnvC (AmiA/AmiB activator)